jgi:hypothetical protein
MLMILESDISYTPITILLAPTIFKITAKTS